MRHSTTCKFCHKPIFPEITDEYAELGDPFKILPMAACNPCADVRVKRREVEGKIRRICADLSQMKRKPQDAAIKIVREALTTLTMQYCKIIAEWHNMSGSAWDTVVVDMLIETPDEWGNILSRLWILFKQHCVPKTT